MWWLFALVIGLFVNPQWSRLHSALWRSASGDGVPVTLDEALVWSSWGPLNPLVQWVSPAGPRSDVVVTADDFAFRDLLTGDVADWSRCPAIIFATNTFDAAIYGRWTSMGWEADSATSTTDGAVLKSWQRYAILHGYCLLELHTTRPREIIDQGVHPYFYRYVGLSLLSEVDVPLIYVDTDVVITSPTQSLTSLLAGLSADMLLAADRRSEPFPKKPGVNAGVQVHRGGAYCRALAHRVLYQGRRVLPQLLSSLFFNGVMEQPMLNLLLAVDYDLHMPDLLGEGPVLVRSQSEGLPRLVVVTQDVFNTFPEKHTPEHFMLHAAGVSPAEKRQQLLSTAAEIQS
ncbi:MAG: uncharacterized protein KVP18_003558 [Porospora cf. gigantea A]|uniref:uncharacterized protein n=2 Tax=Porospora cf. gigantea A TaxID=2853593 RepID=UPI00355973D9|nr:MAG: hypothetical protein KVP18_003558 [Porospora cf. gigantea A]